MTFKIYELSLYTSDVTASDVSEMKNPPTADQTRPTVGLWLWKWWELFSRISAPIFFPVFSYLFLDRFFTYDTQISTENIYRILIKQTGQRYNALSMHLEYAPKSNVATPGFKNETMLSLWLLIVNNGTRTYALCGYPNGALSFLSAVVSCVPTIEQLVLMNFKRLSRDGNQWKSLKISAPLPLIKTYSISTPFQPNSSRWSRIEKKTARGTGPFKDFFASMTS
jgi:hypothetical protein